MTIWAPGFSPLMPQKANIAENAKQLVDSTKQVVGAYLKNIALQSETGHIGIMLMPNMAIKPEQKSHDPQKKLGHISRTEPHNSEMNQTVYSLGYISSIQMLKMAKKPNRKLGRVSETEPCRAKQTKILALWAIYKIC